MTAANLNPSIIDHDAASPQIVLGVNPRKRKFVERGGSLGELDAILRSLESAERTEEARPDVARPDVARPAKDYSTAVLSDPNYKSLPLRERNRLSAERSRKRRMKKMQQLQEENILKETVKRLQLENASLQKEERRSALHQLNTELAMSDAAKSMWGLPEL